MKTLVVISHPRKNSLTFAVSHEIIRELKEQRYEVEILDLHGNNFDPLVFPVTRCCRE
ncbi:NAD(P)H-dependent oxidoreductase [Lysinibacillus pakistanensis]|uniref:NAD(P)H-dependent oxidoreductase n=1 Tax=Lysinibacillus pakistanensis TaxID=759811 RepID=UPI003D269355